MIRDMLLECYFKEDRKYRELIDQYNAFRKANGVKINTSCAKWQEIRMQGLKVMKYVYELENLERRNELLNKIKKLPLM